MHTAQAAAADHIVTVFNQIQADSRDIKIHFVLSCRISRTIQLRQKNQTEDRLHIVCQSKHKTSPAERPLRGCPAGSRSPSFKEWPRFGWRVRSGFALYLPHTHTHTHTHLPSYRNHNNKQTHSLFSPNTFFLHVFQKNSPLQQSVCSSGLDMRKSKASCFPPSQHRECTTASSFVSAAWIIRT